MNCPCSFYTHDQHGSPTGAVALCGTKPEKRLACNLASTAKRDALQLEQIIAGGEGLEHDNAGGLWENLTQYNPLREASRLKLRKDLVLMFG